MTNYINKLKHIVPTFLIISLGSVIGVLLFRWLFCVQFPIIDIKEEVWEFWIPIILPWIVMTLWFRQRLRVLTFKRDNDKGRVFFQFIAWLSMFAMLAISQNYLTTASGKLKTIESIDDIDKVEKSRYYKLNNFIVATYFGGTYTDFRTSGKYNQHLNFDIFFITPIVPDSTMIQSVPKKWYGVKFQKQINNRISNEEKERKYKDFFSECVQKMKSYNFHSLDHFERIPTSDDRENYLKAIEARTKEKADDSFVILKPVQEEFEKRNGNKFAWIFGSFGIGLGILLFSLIWPGYSETERKKFLQGKKPKQDDIADMLNYLIPKGSHFVTSIILDLNILVFLIMIFSGINIISPSGLELLEWGGNRRIETMNGEWWRLFTSMFLHGGIMHLFLNIYGLVIAALFIEPILGRKNYFTLYLLSGLCGSLASIWWYPNIISVGASGAIFGLYGAILGLLLTDAFPKEGKRFVFMMIGIYVFINLLWGLTGGIDNAAHIGGLISGAFIGILLYKIDSKKKNASSFEGRSGNNTDKLYTKIVLSIGILIIIFSLIPIIKNRDTSIKKQQHSTQNKLNLYNLKNCIIWRQGVNISIKDFEMSPDYNSEQNMFFWNGITLESNGYGGFEALAIFDKSKSWTKDTIQFNYKEILEVQKLSFDLAELYARKMNAEIRKVRDNEVNDTLELENLDKHCRMIYEKYEKANSQMLLNGETTKEIISYWRPKIDQALSESK
ncbi:hypothetical protein FEDK69T_11110 [Flavobacterium enshiense DK69]|uniref:rhomboid family intramembrane serine protease n=1 Tax=Flavobacterium enshiense TaxID=1341165 RepID=UPI0003C57437|nr:rhomboid family intramembrane serine protease [Flavobacterium enshiense]ESU23707.1 hypothetical protein FEDK69T_11110 [Flavobacterium enshiense DK69]